MDTKEYEFIKSRLNKPEDVELMHKKMGLRRDMLYNILGRKIVRKVMKDFYKIKKKQPQMLKRWKKDESFVEIAESIDFPPVLTASFILQEKGFTKPGVQRFVNNLESISDKRLRKEMKEALEKDFVYSPRSTEMQFENGKRAEDEIENWLRTKDQDFITEKEGKFTYEKTPDFLLRKKMKILGHETHWVESKASFGSPNEMKRNYKKQLKPYLDLFGPGVVVYWYGFVDDVDIDKDILTIDDSFFKKKR